MIPFEVIKALSGLALVFLSLRVMTHSLDESVILKIGPIIKYLDKGILKPLLFGLIFTAFTQSSSMTVIVIMGLLIKGPLTFTSSFYMMLGSTVGTTLKGWIYLYSWEYVGPLLLILSSFSLLFVKTHRSRKYIEYFLSIGLMFLGWFMMGEGLRPILNSDLMVEILKNLSGDTFSNILFTAFIGFLLTTLIQSSSTVIFLVISLAESNSLPYIVAVGLILGANIGTTMTHVFASLEYNKNVKRLAFSHFFIKAFGVLMALLSLKLFLNTVDFLFLKQMNNVTIGTKCAAIHTGFNIINSLIWPFLSPFLFKLLYTFFPKDLGHGRMWLTPPVRNLLVQLPNHAMGEIKKEWKILKDKVKGLEDEVFSYLISKKSVELRPRSGPNFILSDILAVEEILIGMMVQKNANNKNAVHFLSSFSQLKLVYEDIINLKKHVESLTDKDLDLIRESLKDHFLEINKRRNKIWKTIFTDRHFDPQKTNRKVLKKLEEQIVSACGNQEKLGKEQVIILYQISIGLLGHLQRLINLAIKDTYDYSEKQDFPTSTH